MMWLIGAFALAIFMTWITTPWASALSFRMNVLERAGTAQAQPPIARLGGVAIVVPSICIAWSFFVCINRFSFALPQNVVPLVGVSLAVFAVFLLGIVDDILNVKAKYKLLLILLIATGVGLAGVRVVQFEIPGHGTIVSPWATTPLSVVFLAGVCVAINLIDRVDGLAAGLGAIASAVIATIAALSGDANYVFVAILASCVSGSCIGFLWYNWPKASVHLGNAGSLTLGFAIGGLGMLLAHRGENNWAYGSTLVVLAVPILDMAFCFFRRIILERRSIFGAEHGQLHQRLLDAGLKLPQVLRLLLGLTLVCGGAAVWLCLSPSRWSIGFACASLIPLLFVFRAAGSVRLRETLSAIHVAISRSRENERYNRAFEQMQLRFQSVTTFNQWWSELCEAGRRLEIASIDLNCTNRDGTTRELAWSSAQFDSRAHSVQLSLPVPQRRIDSPIACRLSVSRNGSLESVGYRMSLFGRLLENHGLERLPKSGPVRLRQQSTVLRLAGLSERAATLQSTTKVLQGRVTDDSLPLEIDQPIVRKPVEPAATSLAKPTAKPRVAVVHDFLYIYGGAERVLENILAIYPDADLFSLFDFLDSEQRKFIGDRKVKTSFIQRLPFARRFHRHFLALMPLAVEQLDMRGYDIVISSSYLAAKGVLTGPDQLHVCYCHTPARYAWDLQEQCLDEAGIKRGLKSLIARGVLHYIRAWDLRSSHGVDAFVTNSNFVKRRVKKIYGREATTIYPPVDVTNFALCNEKENFYLTASRLVPYKKIALIAEAFTMMPDKRLVIIGDGPEFEAIRARSGPNVILKGFLPKDAMIDYMQRARAFVFTAIEDFGIVPVEAQACGTPVIGLNKGGLCESVVDGETGVLFDEQTPESIIDAVRRFESREGWNARHIRNHAMRFSVGRFQAELSAFVENLSAKHFANATSDPATIDQTMEMNLLEANESTKVS